MDYLVECVIFKFLLVTDYKQVVCLIFKVALLSCIKLTTKLRSYFLHPIACAPYTFQYTT
jgi:hypothetical protein